MKFQFSDNSTLKDERFIKLVTEIVKIAAIFNKTYTSETDVVQTALSA